MISFFIGVAKESLAINNYNTSYAIVAGLNFPGLSRLKSTWQKVSKKDLDSYEQLLSFWSTSRNYKTYRAALKSAIPPCVPWLGLTAKDLFHIEDSAPTFVTEPVDGVEVEKINFNKLHLIWKSVSFLQTLQKFDYPTKKDPSVQKMLSSVKDTVADENEGMSLSYKYEAKATK
jgi:son of sevenless-like protein